MLAHEIKLNKIEGLFKKEQVLKVKISFAHFTHNGIRRGFTFIYMQLKIKVTYIYR